MKYVIMGVKLPIFCFDTREEADRWLAMLREPPDGPTREAARRFTIVEMEKSPAYPPVGGYRKDGTPCRFELDPVTGYARPEEHFK